jgi:SAM-dependent methyltransferase
VFDVTLLKTRKKFLKMSLHNCRICNSYEFEKQILVKEMMFNTNKVYHYYKCSHCGVLQIEKPEEDSEYLYPSNYYSFSSRANSIKNKVKQLFNKWSVAKELTEESIMPRILPLRESKDAASLKGYVKKDQAILDVGCGTGELIMALYDIGYQDIKGIDPYIKETFSYKNALIEKKSLVELENEKFDLIMLHHSFEHMDNPLEIMTKIKNLLTPTGLCIIRIPVSDSYSFEYYKENWVQLDAPRHVFLHTNKSILHLASTVDLRIEKIVDDSGIFQFVGSEQYKQNISLSAPNSYYRAMHKKLFGKEIFSKKQIADFKLQATNLNKIGNGDQRIYYIRHN